MSRYSVFGIDAASNQVLSVLATGYGGVLACDPARNVLFVPNEDTLLVVDCSADTVAAAVELPLDGAVTAAFDPLDDKIYVAHDEGGG